jgi:hypothetical protein
MTKEVEIIEIGVEEGVDLGYVIKDSLLLFYHSMVCECRAIITNST